MRMRGLYKRMQSIRIIALFLALLLAYGLVSYSLHAETQLKVFSISLRGVTGSANNTVLVFGRYVLVAPFAPTKGVTENGDLDLELLDNYSIYLIDTKKPQPSPISKDLSTWDPRSGTFKKIYFPSRVVFDPNSNNVYVRGTRFEEQDGEITPIDVIAYVNLSQDEDGRPLFDNNVVPISIPGVGSSDYTSTAPLDLAFSGAGDVLVFTNGASLFSCNLPDGILHEIELVDPNEYSADDCISSVAVDQATNVVSVCWNKRVVDNNNTATTSSELWFYRLGELGSLHFLDRVNREDFLSGEALAAGSNIAIVSDGGKDGSETAVFMTNSGTLCAVDLRNDGAATIKRLYTFFELAQSEPEDPGPVSVQYDPATRTVGIVRPGFIVQISRPINGKRGRISRPINVRVRSGTPVLAMARLTRKNKLGSVNSFINDFSGEGGLSNFVTAEGSQWLIATHSGKLYSVGIADDVQDSRLQYIGTIGSSVDTIDYYSNRSSIVAISSFAPGDDEIGVAEEGLLVVAKITESTPLIQAILPTVAALGRSSPAIRRPCNIRR